MHAPEEKREDKTMITPPFFALLLCVRALSSNEYKYNRVGAPARMASFGQSARGQGVNSTVYGSFVKCYVETT